MQTVRLNGVRLRDEGGHEINCSEEALKFLFAAWQLQFYDRFVFLGSWLYIIWRDHSTKVFNLLFLNMTLLGVELDACCTSFINGF